MESLNVIEFDGDVIDCFKANAINISITSSMYQDEFKTTAFTTNLFDKIKDVQNNWDTLQQETMEYLEYLLTISAKDVPKKFKNLKKKKSKKLPADFTEDEYSKGYEVYKSIKDQTNLDDKTIKEFLYTSIYLKDKYNVNVNHFFNDIYYHSDEYDVTDNIELAYKTLIEHTASTQNITVDELLHQSNEELLHQLDLLMTISDNIDKFKE